MQPGNHEGTKFREEHEDLLYKIILRDLRGSPCLRDKVPACVLRLTCQIHLPIVTDLTLGYPRTSKMRRLPSRSATRLKFGRGSRFRTDAMPRTSQKGLCLAVLAWALLLPVVARAQQASGIVGEVKGPPGAVMPGVTVQAASSGLGPTGHS